jgi:hypothetical protein
MSHYPNDEELLQFHAAFVLSGSEGETDVTPLLYAPSKTPQCNSVQYINKIRFLLNEHHIQPLMGS